MATELTLSRSMMDDLDAGIATQLQLPGLCKLSGRHTAALIQAAQAHEGPCAEQVDMPSLSNIFSASGVLLKQPCVRFLV